MSKRSALSFIVIMGFVSLFGDFTYEGARSALGPFLASLGASAFAVAFTAGLGEMIAYALRFVFGYFSDLSRRYWIFIFFGYGLNLFAVPALALAPSWEIAAIFILLERLGKAIRKPAGDALLGQISRDLGRGKGFGIHEALDQVGACLGPLFMALILAWRQSYREAFGFLIFSAIIAMIFLVWGRFNFQKHQEGKAPKATTKSARFQFASNFWFFVIGASIFAAGFVDFPLISFHFAKSGHFSKEIIPMLYAMAMGIDAVAALVLGFLFDKRGMIVVILSVLFTAIAPLLVFSSHSYLVIIGMLLWGIALGASESAFKAALANFVNEDRLATAFGLFNGFFGIAWFLGSATLGFLYQHSISWLIAFSITLQLLSLPFFVMATRTKSRQN